MRHVLAFVILATLGCGDAGTGPDSQEDASTVLPDGGACPSGERVCPGTNYCRPLYDVHNCGSCGVSCNAAHPDCVRTSAGTYACQ